MKIFKMDVDGFVKKYGKAALTGCLMLASGAVMADGTSNIPQEALDAFDTMTANFTSLTAKAWPYVLLVVGGFVSIRLVKKLLSQAS